MATFAALPVLASMDVWHWHLVPFRLASLRWIGLAAFAGGWWIVHVALRENAFALTVVRHQHERKQTVITSGPYSIVRHPMYSGLLILMPGLGVWLGSLIAAAASLIPITILATRIIFEERLLCAHLPEYKSYAEVTRSRLLPGIW